MGRKVKRKEDVYEQIAMNIRYYRKLKKMTQAELAEKTQYSHEFIRRVEAPKVKKTFSIDTICHIADALDIDVRMLFEQSEKK